MRYHYIYKITCLCGSLAGHYYLGKHSTDAIPENCGYAGSGKILKNYYQKYGQEKGITYNIEILEKNPDGKTNAIREKEILGDKYNSDPMCLNLKAGGDGGGVIGHKHSEETKNRISAILKGNPKLSHKGEEHPMYGRHLAVSEETKEKIRQKLTGIKRSKEFCRQISERCKGKPVPQDVREKISNTLKGNICWNKMQGAKESLIIQYSLDGRFVRTWNLLTDCFTGYRLDKIKACCNGTRKTAYKSRWKWFSRRFSS